MLITGGKEWRWQLTEGCYGGGNSFSCHRCLTTTGIAISTFTIVRLGRGKNMDFEKTLYSKAVSLALAIPCYSSIPGNRNWQIETADWNLDVRLDIWVKMSKETVCKPRNIA